MESDTRLVNLASLSLSFLTCPMGMMIAYLADSMPGICLVLRTHQSSLLVRVQI